MRLRFTTAAQVFDAFPTAADDIAAKPSDLHPFEYLNQLLSSEMPEDAIGFSAYMLPRREAVQWACQCVRATMPELDAESAGLLQIAEKWVEVPEEDNRRTALDAGVAAMNSGPAAWCALAAGWSGGSIIADLARPIPPPPHVTAQLTRAAVLTALAFVPAKDRRDQLNNAVRAATSLVE